jgi:sensor c-di-GMP phosphodiesterase-like protein
MVRFSFRRSRIAQAAIIVLSVGAFIAGAEIVSNNLIDGQNRRQLQEINARIVERAEIAVDYAYIALGQLAEAGMARCEADALVEIRRQVYQRGTIKDIRVYENGGQVSCSAFPQTLDFDARRIDAPRKFPARNEQLQLFRLEQTAGVALGLLWAADADTTLIAVVSTDALLFDSLPAGLRDNSKAFLKLDGGNIVASFSGTAAEEQPARVVEFAATSERYPLIASVEVGGAAFAHWNKEVQPSVPFLAGVLGLLFGLLLRSFIAAPASPLNELDDGLVAKEFKPHLQPIFSLATGAIVGCEVLARWYRGDGMIVMPDRFIALAEESGRIAQLTRQIVTQALARLRPVMRLNKDFKVSFNISPVQFLSENFVDEFRQLVADAQVATRQIVIELTERRELHDLQAAAAVIADLREYGFKVAIDDAGIGHSGLSYIQKLGVNIIKIDKFFVDSIGLDHSANAVIEMLVGLARKLNMTTVAEGVETNEQIAALRACGVDEGQGYVVAPPLQVETFLDLMGALDAAAAPDAARKAVGRGLRAA